jgi:hypothetical protein
MLESMLEQKLSRQLKRLEAKYGLEEAVNGDGVLE